MRLSYSAVDSFDAGFRCAYFFHYGNRELAREIVFRVSDDLNVQTIRLKNKLDSSRKQAGQSGGAVQVKTLSLQGSQLFQYLVLLESAEIERQQEADGVSGIQEEDLVIRYIKHAVTAVWRRSSLHMAVVLWRIVHNYPTEQLRRVDEFFTEEPSASFGDDCRRAKKNLMRSLQKRFGIHLEVLVLAGNEQRFRSKDWMLHLEFISQCLEMLTPWNTPCLMAEDAAAKEGEAPRGLRGRQLRAADQEQVERNRIHSHIHPLCFARLAQINGLNESRKMLDLPRFISCASRGSDDPPIGKRNLPHLDVGEIAELKRIVTAQAGRRRACAPRLLRVLVDGELCAVLKIGDTQWPDIEIGNGAELLKIYSEDNDGAVLLATHLFEYDDDGNFSTDDSMVRLPGGKQITLRVAPNETGGGGSLQIEYRVQLLSYLAAYTLGRAGAQIRLFPPLSLGFGRPRLVFGFVGVLAMCVAGWFAFDRLSELADKQRQLRAQLAEASRREFSLEQTIKNENQRSLELQEQIAKLHGQRQQSPAIPAMPDPSFILYPGIDRGRQSRKFALEKSSTPVTLKLHRSAGSSATQVFAIVSVAGESEIWNQQISGLKQPSIVELVLPRNLFPAGHYTVKISSIDQAGEPAKPDYYAFEVIAR